MITHDQVEDEISFLRTQIKAWDRLRRAIDNMGLMIECGDRIQILQERIETLKKWNSERWNPEEYPLQGELCPHGGIP